MDSRLRPMPLLVLCTQCQSANLSFDLPEQRPMTMDEFAKEYGTGVRDLTALAEFSMSIVCQDCNYTVSYGVETKWDEQRATLLVDEMVKGDVLPKV